jgi:hypothetical protein
MCYTEIRRSGMKRRIFTKEELEIVFRINETGELQRLLRGKDWRVVECKANHNKGYCLVGFKGSHIMYHTIIWVLTNGTIEDAEAVIDHISGDKLDNRIENLRLVSTRENQQNQVNHRKGKLTGCCLHKCGKWQAQITISGKLIHLGLYNTEPEAHKIYLKACELINEYVDNDQFRKLINKSIFSSFP